LDDDHVDAGIRGDERVEVEQIGWEGFDGRVSACPGMPCDGSDPVPRGVQAADDRGALGSGGAVDGNDGFTHGPNLVP
jgi:hypothetical protein